MIINILQEFYSLFFDNSLVVLTILQIYKKVAEITSSNSCESHKQKKEGPRPYSPEPYKSKQN